MYNLSVADDSLWKETKLLLKFKFPSSPLRKADNILAISDLEKAEVFQTYLSNIFQPNTDILNFRNIGRLC